MRDMSGSEALRDDGANSGTEPRESCRGARGWDAASCGTGKWWRCHQAVHAAVLCLGSGLLCVSSGGSSTLTRHCGGRDRVFRVVVSVDGGRSLWLLDVEERGLGFSGD